jgi:hypothetical protein
MDGVDSFHAAYQRGQIVPMPDDYMDLIILPSITGVDPLRFAMDYPPLLRVKMRQLAMAHIAKGWAGNTETIDRGKS